MTIDELQVLVTANTSQLKKELASARGDISRLTNQSATIGDRIPKHFGMAATAASAFGNVLANVVMAGIHSIGSAMGDAVTRLDTLKNYPRVMQSLGFSSEDASKSITMLQNSILGLPTSLDFIVRQTQGLAAVSPNLASATNRAIAMNNALLAGGAPVERVNDAFAQWQQMLGTGIADMQSWRVLMQVMPGQLNQLAKSLLGASANSSTLQDAIMNGKVSVQQLADEVVKLNKTGYDGFGSFEQQARAATGGVATSMTNVKIAITRGLAQIMDAVGQANIAAFFNAIVGMINATVPYVVAFVKVMVMAVSWISQLFGGKGINSNKQVAKSADSAAASVGGVAKNADAAGGALDNAAGKAKKLQNQLAGFDQMNVLNPPSGDSGSGSGAGTGGGDPNMGFDLGNADTSGVDKVQAKVQALLGFVKQVGDVFKTIWNSAPVQAFAGLVGAELKFMWDLISQLGKALWDNLVGTWQIIEPNVVSGALNVSALFTNMWTDMTTALNTYSQPIIDGTVGLFNSMYTDAFEPYVILLSQVWVDFTGTLLTTWNKYGAGILDGLGKFYVNVIAIFQKIWDDVIAPIITPFLQMLTQLWNDHLKAMVDEFADFVGKLIKFALDIFNNVIAPITKWLLDVLKPAFAFVGAFIAGVFGTIFGTIADVVGAIFKVLGGLIDFIAGVFTGNWSRAWSGITSIFSGIFGGIVAIAKAPLNILIDLINSFIAGINAIKIPDWVPGVGGKNLNIPRIPKLATGGIIDKATLAVVGESGREAVMPLENNTGWITELASKISAQNGGGQPTQIVVKIGEDTIVDRVIDGINDKAYMTNGGVITV